MLIASLNLDIFKAQLFSVSKIETDTFGILLDK